LDHEWLENFNLPAEEVAVQRAADRLHPVMRGVSLRVVAAQLGHSDTRMVEKHYRHMAPSYRGYRARAFSNMGLV
jgi:hypothetical protein